MSTKYFNPTWQQVCLLAVLLGAVMIAHLYAPAAIAWITSTVSTIIGAVFINLTPQVEGSDGQPKPLPEKHVMPTGTYTPAGQPTKEEDR